ncbi:MULTISPECIES: right-handed parallel beta-helix repeat-containing protein [unclassified Paenibacillus]|uniref:right-handed parallel beta-helix repeat-containing protein n=1 Tax=unclassified Paenibacillus TaxID=185978 RepID=UPI00240506F3|nr:MULTISPECIES: right-handed parallel beta-helix repeat-containing protein [unclassified Paenibacillus]MDF9839438.1 parallel beta-helix repeat protein [Paenibacillus sp. PastF-2]MDF9846018.1 parallel beta-helix repeat protein [Paenibacillus sp. PastM-2]MDF9852591.1 parallel beta-helix repeat protein [Paenibacillus sp. PastF-1]MDH6477678.1 parallel beta-helix repeat protein [Paenibacillus sp. PastH-2]MDH6505418.1 parallel beta-helix repeat protein [Paenibacillus sp. PastM-3]
MSLNTLRPAILLGVLLLCGCSSVPKETLPDEANAYYVAVGGDDHNPGTIDSPWETLQYAADHAVPGSYIYIRAGVYNQKLHITEGGSETAGPVTFSGYPGEAAVLDGEGLSVDGLEGLVEIDHASYVTIQGLEIRNYQTAARDEVPVAIYVHGSGKYISLLNNRIHSIANTATPAGEDLSGRDAHGIAVYGTEADEPLGELKIDGNEVYDLVLGSSEALVVNGNVDTFEITDNRVHDNDNIGIDIIGYEGTAGDDAVDQARNGTVRGNIVSGISSNNNPSYGASLPNNSYSAGGIYIDGGRSILVEQNRVYDNDIGIELASEHKGKLTSNITVRDNLVYRNRLTGIAMGGYDEERGGTSDSQVVSNTLYQNDLLGGGNGQLYLQANLSRNVISGNIIVAGDTGVLMSNDYTSNIDNTIDNNLYFAEAEADEAVWVWKKREFTGFSAYQRGTGNDQGSRFADPKFADASRDDFRLEPDSPDVNGDSPGAKTD